MTTGRINQVCALPTEATPGGRLHELPEPNHQKRHMSPLPEVTLGMHKQQAIIQEFVKPPSVAPHALQIREILSKSQMVSKSS